MTSFKSTPLSHPVWQRYRKLGCWKFVLLFGVIWWGGFMTVTMGIHEWYSDPDKFVLGTWLTRHLPFYLIGGMLIGCITWYFSEGEYKRHTTETADQTAARMRWWQERRKIGRMNFAFLTGGLGLGVIFTLCISYFTITNGFATGTGLLLTGALCFIFGTLLGLTNWDKHEKDLTRHLSGNDGEKAPLEK